MTRGPRWRIEERHGTAATIHAEEPPPDHGREIWIATASDHAVVLGSAQDAETVDRDRAGAHELEIVRRRSGGGAVLVEPGDLVWLDVLLPRTDPLWVDDVGESFAWLGGAWREALATLGVTAERHGGSMLHSAASAHVCFAGLGPGELTIAGRKVLGMSQRRRRTGARFQCAVPLRWDPAPLIDVFHRVLAGPAVAEVADAGHAVDRPAAAVVGAFVDVLESTT